MGTLELLIWGDIMLNPFSYPDKDFGDGCWFWVLHDWRTLYEKSSKLLAYMASSYFCESGQD